MDNATLISRQKYAKIPSKHRGLTLSAWRPYNGPSEAAGAAARELVESWPHRYVIDAPEGPRDLVGRGLAFIGKPGAGKTTLMALTISELIVTYNVNALFISYPDFLGLLLEQMSVQKMAERGDVDAQERFWAIEDVKRKVYGAPIVGWDEVGAEHHSASGFAEKTVERLMRNRHRNGLPNLLTSNKPFSEWGDTYGEAMSSFVYEAFAELPMGGKDLRRRG